MSGHRCCEDEHEPAERGLEYALYQRIDIEKLQCLNEAREGDGKLVLKPWDQRTDREKFVESDADEELLFNIPFTGRVKLKGIVIAGEDGESHPAEMRLIARFSNIKHLSGHISRNFGTEYTRVYYIGLRGEYSQAHRHELTICNYEVSANPADHKVDSIIPQTNVIS
uniref:PITH (C-terminal proteasome-interacting domain of thioredoxin-like) domain containing 1 n=1 Tax=Oncorhynchus kisutch TaxID=8019 RepID=A0A8C7GDK6_ONCKI